jgi:hypothetical protein
MKINPLRFISAILVLTFFSEQFLYAAETRSIELPENLGVVTRQTAGNGGRQILHIQDAHTKIDSQKNIASLLDYLSSNFDMNLVSMEGASGDIDSSVISAFPDLAVKKKAAEFLLRQGKIGAAELYSMIAEKPVQLYGAEDVALYEKNKQALEALLGSTGIRQSNHFRSRRKNV